MLLDREGLRSNIMRMPGEQVAIIPSPFGRTAAGGGGKRASAPRLLASGKL
jgi:hypothetical protein